MEKDKLLEGLLNGTVTDEQFNEELNKLPEEKQKEIKDSLSPEKLADLRKKEIERIAALRKEGQRLEERNKEREKQTPPPPSNAIETLRLENIQSASEKFFSQFGITDETVKSRYKESVTKNPSSPVREDLIFNEFKRIYASEHADELITAKAKADEFAKNAEEFNAQGAGAHGAGGGAEGGKKYSDEAYRLVSIARKEGNSLTLEQAEKYLQGGTGRIYS